MAPSSPRAGRRQLGPRPVVGSTAASASGGATQVRVLPPTHACMQGWGQAARTVALQGLHAVVPQTPRSRFERCMRTPCVGSPSQRQQKCGPGNEAGRDACEPHDVVICTHNVVICTGVFRSPHRVFRSGTSNFSLVRSHPGRLTTPLPCMHPGTSADPAGSSTDHASSSTDHTEVSYTLSKELLTELVTVVGAHMRGTFPHT